MPEIQPNNEEPNTRLHANGNEYYLLASRAPSTHFEASSSSVTTFWPLYGFRFVWHSEKSILDRPHFLLKVGGKTLMILPEAVWSIYRISAVYLLTASGMH